MSKVLCDFFYSQGRTLLNNSPIEIHVKMPDFKTHFLCSGYIYHLFPIFAHFDSDVNFNLNPVSLGVINFNFPLRARKERPQFSQRLGRYFVRKT